MQKFSFPKIKMQLEPIFFRTANCFFRPKFLMIWSPSPSFVRVNSARRLPIPCAFLKCGPGRTRTAYLRNANAVFYQVNYRPANFVCKERMAEKLSMPSETKCFISVVPHFRSGRSCFRPIAILLGKQGVGNAGFEPATSSM